MAAALNFQYSASRWQNWTKLKVNFTFSLINTHTLKVLTKIELSVTQCILKTHILSPTLTLNPSLNPQKAL